VGTYIAAGFPAFIALVSDPVDAIWVIAFATLYQQVENYIFAPRITARTMDLHPAVAFGAVLAGIGVLGGIGALLALPASAVVQALGSTYIERHDVVASHMTAAPPKRRSGRFGRVLRGWRSRRLQPGGDDDAEGPGRRQAGAPPRPDDAAAPDDGGAGGSPGS
jgi:hypothetical protein